MMTPRRKASTRQLLQAVQRLTKTVPTFILASVLSVSAAGAPDLEPHPHRFGPEHSQPRLDASNRSDLYIEHRVENIWMYRPSEYRIDAEVYQLLARTRLRLSERYEISLDVPFRYLSGGILDRVIEDFHARFDWTMPDGRTLPVPT